MEVTKVTRPARKLLPLKTCGAVIVAAGSASRMGGIDKVMAPLGGEPMIVRTVRVFPELRCHCFHRHCYPGGLDSAHFRPVPGYEQGHRRGLRRQQPTGIGASGAEPLCPKAPSWPPVHDGARPLVSWQVIDRVVRAANTYGGAAPAIPVKDTIKVVKGGLVESTPDRASLQAVQTPQVFDFDLLRGALKKAEEDKAQVTDDCSAVERLGMKIKIVEGDERNLKVTTPMDLKIAELLLEETK